MKLATGLVNNEFATVCSTIAFTNASTSDHRFKHSDIKWSAAPPLARARSFPRTGRMLLWFCLLRHYCWAETCRRRFPRFGFWPPLECVPRRLYQLPPRSGPLFCFYQTSAWRRHCCRSLRARPPMVCCSPGRQSTHPGEQKHEHGRHQRRFRSNSFCYSSIRLKRVLLQPRLQKIVLHTEEDLGWDAN